MKLRLVVVSGIFLSAAVASAAPLRNVIEVRDAAGQLYANVVICNDCKEGAAPSSKPCDPGAVEGWVDDKPCGSCLMKSNFGTLVRFPFDLQVTGELVDKDGNPVAQRFVKMFLPNGWGMRSKTTDRGTFRLLLGATDQRRDDKPFKVDIGRRVDSLSGTDEQFSLYLLQPGYTPCAGSEPDEPADPKTRGLR